MDKYKKYTDRIESLIKEFNEEIYPKRERGNWGDSYPESMYDKLQGWLMKGENILYIIFSEDSVQIKRFRHLRDDLKEGNLANKIKQIKGLLEACLDDLKNGFIQGQEFIIANEVFDSVLEEAEFYLKQQKNKDISAILLRIVIEDSLRRISNREGIVIIGEDGKNKKAAVLNDELKGKDFYNQTTWRQIQVWLDIGNDAAHGNFEKYTYEQVSSFYEGLVNFITTYFKP
jgi:hypothetical protein